MEVLVYLARRPGEVVARDTLIRDVWGETFVTDHVLTRCIAELRKVFDDDVREPRVIQTIAKSGYRLIAAVEPADNGAGAGSTAAPVQQDRPAPTSQPRLRVAVAALLVAGGLVTGAAVTWLVLRPAPPAVPPVLRAALP